MDERYYVEVLRYSEWCESDEAISWVNEWIREICYEQTVCDCAAGE